MAESILDTIVDNVRRRLAWTPEAPGLERLALRIVEQRRRQGLRSLHKALYGDDPEVIAECKKASPSAGVIRDKFDPVALARAYAAGRAAAVSVVTEPDSFQGSPLWLAKVREAVSIPVLRKDFIVERRQLFESVILGADAVLLISRILPEKRLHALVTTANMLDLEVLLEIFVDEDPGPAIDSGVPILGVNSRDLATFEVDLDRAEELAARLPDDRIKVAESGIHGPEHVSRLHRAGYGAFLVGEHLVRSDNPERAVRRLIGQHARFG